MKPFRTRFFRVCLLLLLVLQLAPAQALTDPYRARISLASKTAVPADLTLKEGRSKRVVAGNNPINFSDPSGLDEIRTLNAFQNLQNAPSFGRNFPFNSKTFYLSLKQTTGLLYTLSHSYSDEKTDSVVGYNSHPHVAHLRRNELRDEIPLSKIAQREDGSYPNILYSSGCKLAEDSRFYESTIGKFVGPTNNAVVGWAARTNILQTPLIEFDKVFVKRLLDGQTVAAAKAGAIADFRQMGDKWHGNFADFAEKNLKIWGNPDATFR